MKEIANGVYIGETFCHYVYCNKCNKRKWCIAFYDENGNFPYSFLCEECLKIIKEELCQLERKEEK
ncbi:MAG: hypothetical protein DRP29_04715 [Thermodesulfobacteriota bacterium]|nr:MAG: hypothetical protein DRP29_04715 [Thermodesulfobacteriota bacterium]